MNTERRGISKTCNKAGKLGFSVGLMVPILVAISIAEPVGAQENPCSDWSTASVGLRSRVIGPSTGVEFNSLFPRPTVHPDRDDNVVRHVMVRFERLPKPNDHKKLEEAGIKLLDYLGDCVYNVAVTRRLWSDISDRRILEDAEIRLLDRFRPIDKISPAIRGQRYFAWAVGPSRELVKVLIGFHRDVSSNRARGELNGITGVFAASQHGPSTWAAVVRTDSIETLAELESVRSIEQGPLSPVPHNNTARSSVGSDNVQQFSLIGSQPSYAVSGEGVRIGICDAAGFYGIFEEHPDFQWVDAAGLPAGGTRVFGDRPGGDDHATGVASVAAGSGQMSEESGYEAFSLRGHAPEALIGDYTNFGSEALLYFEAIECDEIDVTNHSYRQTVNDYNEEAALIDQIVRGDLILPCRGRISARPQVWSVGNSGDEDRDPDSDQRGYHSVFAPAKNTIAVGSINSENGRLTRKSSLGPTFDGRIKPDVLAPGCRVVSTTDEGGFVDEGILAASVTDTFPPSTPSPTYYKMCGTSMAAPVVAGIIALMKDRYNQTFGGFPDPDLLPSTYKAVLINTAVDQIKENDYGDGAVFINPDTGNQILYHEGPDVATGFGLVDAVGAVEIFSSADSRKWQEAFFDTYGESESRAWCVGVPEGEDEFKVTLAWDDEPATNLSDQFAPKLVNDLDLLLVSPSGAEHLPWTIKAPAPSGGTGDVTGSITASALQAERDVDRLNNVELATVSDPEDGIWQVKVSDHVHTSSSPQRYSVVSSHDFLDFCPTTGTGRVCDEYPWLCRYTRSRGLDVADGIWFVDPRRPLPIRDICRLVPICPMAERKTWEPIPGLEIMLRGVPENARILVFDHRGTVLQELDPPPTRAAVRVISVETVQPGQELFVGFAGPTGVPLRSQFRVEYSVRAIPVTP